MAIVDRLKKTAAHGFLFVQSFLGTRRRAFVSRRLVKTEPATILTQSRKKYCPELSILPQDRRAYLETHLHWLSGAPLEEC